MQHDWATWSYLERIARASEAAANSQAGTRREVAKVRQDLRDLVTWVRRAALIAALWGSGLGLHLTHEQAVELVLGLLKR